MRVTMRTLYNQIKTDLGSITEQMNLMTSRLSSGKIYRRPSDAPVALTHALSIRTQLATTSQVKRNIVYAQGWQRATENVLQKVEERLERAKTLAIQGANDSQNVETRRAIAEEVRGILEEVVSLGNTRFGGRYIFGGTKTGGYEAGEGPFVLQGGGEVAYKGNRDVIELRVSDSTKMSINLDGDSAFLEGGVFDALKRLYDSLVTDSRDDVDASIGKIDLALKHVNREIAKVGALSNSLDSYSQVADSMELTDTERLSDIEDADMVKTAADLAVLQTSYQASLAAASKVMQLSLADFI